LVNASYWALEMEDEIRENSDISLVGEYEPTFYGFDDFQTELKPSDFKME
jgi:hypothetical protein